MSWELYPIRHQCCEDPTCPSNSAYSQRLRNEMDDFVVGSLLRKMPWESTQDYLIKVLNMPWIEVEDKATYIIKNIPVLADKNRNVV